MGKPITNITIVGGGTAGWLSALLLNRIIQRSDGSKRPLDITLIESPNVPTVGVGEATVPGMPRTLRSAGISEKEFFRSCNASFKLGVMFRGWNVDKKGKPFDFINPFARMRTIEGMDPGYFQLRYGSGDRQFAQTYTPAVDLFHACKGPRPLGQKEFGGPVGFAYHLDAGAFARMLRGLCIERGVKHVLDDVVHVEQDPETGYITALDLKEQGRHEVELVIDCTGFKGLIINEVLKEPFLSYSKHLANDRAMAVQIPHKDPTKLPSATQSTALGAGWVWRVPLFHRVGTGYVFSSAHRTDEEARAEFLAHLGDEAEGAEPRVIPMRIGRTERTWVKNCVAVGLSGGFIEPLESTAIHMIDMSIRWLATYFPDSDFEDPTRDRFNKLMTALYDEIRDFICLHYALGNRTDDPYWVDARNMEMPDSLAENLELWKHVLPSPYDLEFDSFFDYDTYQTVMMGKRVYEHGYGSPNLVKSLPLRKEVWKQVLDNSRKATRQIVRDMADHHTLLKELRGELPMTGQAPAGQFGNFGMAQATVPLPGMGAPRATKPPELEDDASLL